MFHQIRYTAGGHGSIEGSGHQVLGRVPRRCAVGVGLQGCGQERGVGLARGLEPVSLVPPLDLDSGREDLFSVSLLASLIGMGRTGPSYPAVLHSDDPPDDARRSYSDIGDDHASEY